MTEQIIVNLVGRGGTVEAYVSAEDQTPGTATWFSASDEHEGGPSGGAGAQAEGSSAAVGLIGGISDRRSFERLRRARTVGRGGPLTVRFAPPEPDQHECTDIRIAFSIGRRVGNAVDRNRLRRRIREIMASKVRTDPAQVPRGAYLVIASPAAKTASFPELERHLDRAIEQILAKETNPGKEMPEQTPRHTDD